MKVDKSKWGRKTLKDIGIIVSGATPRTDDPLNWGDKYNWVTPAELKGEKYIGRTQKQITDHALSKTKLTLMPPGTVLLSSRAPIGKVAITTEPMYCNQGFKNIVCGNKFFNGFLYYYLIANQKELNRRGNGVTFKEISKKNVEAFPVIVPSLYEQQAIASELDAVQEMIDGYKAQLADLDALAQSIFLDMFGDPITNPKGWKLSNILSFVDEITSSKRIFANEYVKEGVPFYRIKEIIEKANQRPISVELFITENRYNEIKASFGVPKINDLLITAVGSIGEIWIVDNNMPFYFKDGNVIWLKTSKDAVPIYLKEVLFHIIAYIKDKMNGAAYSALTIVKLKAINIPNPPLCFQQQFAKQVKAIEQQKELIRQQLADAETLMAERMQYYFS